MKSGVKFAKHVKQEKETDRDGWASTKKTKINCRVVLLKLPKKVHFDLAFYGNLQLSRNKHLLSLSSRDSLGAMGHGTILTFVFIVTVIEVVSRLMYI